VDLLHNCTLRHKTGYKTVRSQHDYGVPNGIETARNGLLNLLRPFLCSFCFTQLSSIMVYFIFTKCNSNNNNSSSRQSEVSLCYAVLDIHEQLEKLKSVKHTFFSFSPVTIESTQKYIV
jgi:hypothetical protein